MVSLATIDDRTQAFLTNTLGSNAFEVVPLAGDASTRRYYRIVYEGQTMVLMAWEPFNDDGRYPFLNILNHFKKHSVQVPEVIAKSPKDGLVLLEDLGDLTLERKFWENQNQSAVIPFYKLAIDELIKIHYPATQDRSSNCVAFEVSFDTEKLLWEMNYGLEHLFQKMCKLDLSESVLAELRGIFTEICTTLDKQTKLICHRDYHSRNVMIHHNLARVIDFQDARMGTPQYDLVSLLNDSYVELSPPIRNELLEYYLSLSKPFLSTQFSRDEFFNIYRYQTVQRCFKACGSFASFYNSRCDTRYLKYLTPTLRKVEKSLIDFPEFGLFLKIIRDNGLLSRDFMELAHQRLA